MDLGKADEYESRYQAAMKTINQLKTAIHSIFTRIGAGGNSSIEEMLGNQGVTESNMMQYLGIIEQRASEILQAYAASQQMTQVMDRQEFVRAHGSGTGDSGGSTHHRLNMSIQPPAWDDFSSGEDSDQEDDERPLTREELKRKTLRGGVVGVLAGVNASPSVGAAGTAGVGSGGVLGAGGAGSGGKPKDGKARSKPNSSRIT